MDQVEYHRRVGEQLDEFVRADPVVTAASSETERSSTATLDAALLAVAEEAAALHWVRRHAPIGSREAERASSRRIDALGRLAGLLSERARAGPGELDVRSAKFQQLVAIFVDEVRECASANLEVHADKFIEVFLAKMAGWEGRV